MLWRLGGGRLGRERLGFKGPIELEILGRILPTTRGQHSVVPIGGLCIFNIYSNNNNTVERVDCVKMSVPLEAM